MAMGKNAKAMSWRTCRRGSIKHRKGPQKHRKGPQKRRKRTAKELRNTAMYAVGPVLAHLRLKCCIYVIQQFFVALLIFPSQVGGLLVATHATGVSSFTVARSLE